MALELNGTTGVSLVQDGVVTAADLASGAITASALPAGSVLQVVQQQFAIGNENTTLDTYQPSAMHITVQKIKSDSKLLVMTAGGQQYNNNFSNGVISTICQESSSSTFTASTTYSSGNDPASAYGFGMQQVYNQTALNTAPHSHCWLFDSSGNEFEAFRAFFRARTAGRSAQFNESAHVPTMTVMEIAQ